MRRKILVILTGGTICSVYNGEVKVQGYGTKTVLENSFKNSYSEFAESVDFFCTDNYGFFSENMTIDKWNFLLDKIRTMPQVVDTAIKHGCYPSLAKRIIQSEENVFDGIIIAHGTDTLAYSAALFSLLLRDIGVPVFLVSSNEALSADIANGKENFIAAVECICRGIKPNIYVTYKNTDNKMYLHMASQLLECDDYKEDFYSRGMIDISGITSMNCNKLFEKLPHKHDDLLYVNHDGTRFCVDVFEDIKLLDTVLKIEPYVGLNYNFFNLAGVKAVVHGTYHSGTVCAVSTEKGKEDPGTPEFINSSILSFFNNNPTLPVYIAPSKLDGNHYDTIEIVAEHKSGNVQFVNGYTFVMLYVKLLVAISYGLSWDQINEFLSHEYNCEFVINITSKDTRIMYPFGTKKR